MAKKNVLKIGQNNAAKEPARKEAERKKPAERVTERRYYNLNAVWIDRNRYCIVFRFYTGADKKTGEYQFDDVVWSPGSPEEVQEVAEVAAEVAEEMLEEEEAEREEWNGESDCDD